MSTAFYKWAQICLVGLGLLISTTCTHEREEKAREGRVPHTSPKEQLISGFGDFLGFRDHQDIAGHAIYEKALAPVLKQLEAQGTVLRWVDEPNPAGAITASRPESQVPVVWISIDRKLIASTCPDRGDRVEMVWFALLHELQNAMRAQEFRALHEKARVGELSEEEFLRRELETEWDSLCAAYQIYSTVVWPELKTLGFDPRGKVQFTRGSIGLWKKADAVAMYMKSPVGAYYRDQYAKYGHAGNDKESK